MSGVDLDVVDVTTLVTPGSTSATAVVKAGGDGDLLIGAWVTSVTTYKPNFNDSLKTATDANGGALLLGDVLEYHIHVLNTGNDPGLQVVLTDGLPAGTTFVPGSIHVLTGANVGAKTDVVGDDQGEYVATSRSVVVRLGAGANTTAGGTMAIGESSDVSFQVTIDASAAGTVLSNQATISASGLNGAPTTTYHSDDGNGEQQDCLDRCALATKGPAWDDVSGNFRCCASQPDCDNALTCGGWLKHPSPVKSCKKVCDCMFGAGVATSGQGNATATSSPAGYRLATNAVIFDGGDPKAKSIPGTRVLAGGRYTTVEFSVGAPRSDAMKGMGRALPTFRDSAGRVVAATGGVVVRASAAGALTKSRSVAAAHGLPEPAKIQYAQDLYYIEPSSDPWDAVRSLATFQAAGLQAELDMVRPRVWAYVPNDPKFADQWHLRNLGEKESVKGVDGRVSEAWDVTKGSADVVIAINDDGVDVKHPDLADNCLAPLNFPADWEAKKAELGGFGSHGTSVAGVAGAVGDNGIGVSGVCPQCKILPHLLAETVGGSFNLTDKQEADGFVDQVDAGAWIISNSWGPGQGDPRFEVPAFPVGAVNSVVAAGLKYAETIGRAGKGTVVLFAAGNENTKIAAESIFATVVSVGAVDDQGVKAYYSSYGKLLGVAAPSNGGLRGITTVAATPTGAEARYTDEFGGTSSACPFAAGVAGLILSANPDLTAAQVRDVLKASATKIDPVWGKWDTAGHSDFYGAGLVNAYTAVMMAKGTCTDAAQCPAPSDVCTTDCDKTPCGECRTDAECAAEHVCQALPALGRKVCVAKAGTQPCPNGTTLTNGYCVPDRTTCSLCGGAEVCNGRDDDCNGSFDDGIDCPGVPDCIQGGVGCANDEVCAGIHCTTSCTQDTDCTEDGTCAPAKDRYGNFDTSVMGCASQGLSGCYQGCQVLVSSLDDAKMKEFVDCMQDGAAECASLQTCAALLPITY
jgi:uncharacterized repeat protein (TIGR01451 family)